MHHVLSSGPAIVAIASTMAAMSPAPPAQASADREPFAPATGATTFVDTTAELQDAVANLTSNTTILIADGTYNRTSTLNIHNAGNVTIRSESGNRDAVVLQGRGIPHCRRRQYR